MGRLMQPAKPKQWVLQWQSRNMAGPAFWYYDNEGDARETLQAMQAWPSVQASLRECSG
jgi:hypothetical protein